MNTLTPRGARFRHVVFADDVARGGRAVNFAPAADTAGMPGPAPSGPVAGDVHGGHDDAGPTPDAASGWSPVGAATEDERFLRWLFDRAGLDARAYKPETLRRRLGACLRAIRAGSPAHARQILQRAPSLVPVALDTLIIGVTSFFRDRAVFAHLAAHVLPALAERTGGVRVWSAGCSDGAELYSVAMLLAEMRVLHRCYLLGTDCRTEAVRRGTAAVFDAAAVRSVPEGMLHRYFVPAGRDWRVQGWLRTVVQFRTANVLKVTEPGHFDLVLCRNMAIYLHGDPVLRLWAGLEQSLRTGGVLVVGKAERPVGAKSLSTVGPCVYRRTRA